MPCFKNFEASISFRYNHQSSPFWSPSPFLSGDALPLFDPLELDLEKVYFKYIWTWKRKFLILFYCTLAIFCKFAWTILKRTWTSLNLHFPLPETPTEILSRSWPARKKQFKFEGYFLKIVALWHHLKYYMWCFDYKIIKELPTHLLCISLLTLSPAGRPLRLRLGSGPRPSHN